MVYKIVAEEPPSPHRINSTLGSGIESVLRKGLSKKPDARYATCQEFIESLEQACAANKGWQSLPRGGSLNAPTVSDKELGKAALPPPSRRSRRAELTSSGTTERTRQPRSGFLPFLAAILMAAALLAIVAWEIKPTWLFNNPGANENPAQQAESPKPPTPAAAPPPAAAPSTDTPPGSAAVVAPAQTKPSPMPPAPDSTPTPVADEKAPGLDVAAAPAKSAPRVEAPVRHPPAPLRMAAGPQPVTVVSSPKGAIATLDGQADTACTTPCTLEVPPGHHSLELSKSGYDPERRDLDVGSSAVELPAVVMRAVEGTLMLSSDPLGAAVLVNGKRQAQVTPAQIQLAPGSYSVTVEWKDGKQATRTVQIKDGINFQKFMLGSEGGK